MIFKPVLYLISFRKQIGNCYCFQFFYCIEFVTFGYFNITTYKFILQTHPHTCSHTLLKYPVSTFETYLYLTDGLFTITIDNYLHKNMGRSINIKFILQRDPSTLSTTTCRRFRSNHRLPICHRTMSWDSIDPLKIHQKETYS